VNGTSIAQRAEWTIKRALIRLRWPGLGGLALLLFAAGAAGIVIHSGRQRVQELDAEVASLVSRLGQRGSLNAAPSGRGQLSNFYAFFPLIENVPELLGRIHRAALDNQLLLRKGEYKLSREADFRLARYEITLPVNGDYTSVRSFVNEVLQALPSAALDELALKRESADQPELEARVRFSLFLGEER
jgi:hypothetical protein